MVKEKNLIQGQIAADLKSQLDSKLSDLGFTVGKTVETLVEFWLELPTDLQVQIYTHKASGGKLESIISRIVEQKLSEHLKRDKALQKTKARQKEELSHPKATRRGRTANSSKAG